MLIKVKVFPAAGKAAIIKKTRDSYEIWVKAKPIQGMANRAAIAALADYLSIPNDKIRIVKGFRERNKIFEIK